MNSHLFAYARVVRPGIMLIVLLGLLAACATIAQGFLLSRIIARVFFGHAGLDSVRTLLALMLIAVVVRAVLLWGKEMVSRVVAVRAKAELRGRVLQHLMSLGLAYTRTERTGELLTTTTEGIERLDPYISGYLPQIALTIGVPLLITLALLPIDWVSAILLLVTVPIIPLLMILLGGHTEKQLQQQWITLSRLGAVFLDAVQGLSTIVLLDRVSAERQRLAAVSEQFREITVRVLRVASLSGAVLELMTSLAIGLVAVALALRLLDGGISLRQALIVFFLTPEFYRPLRDLGVQYHAGREGKAAAARIAEILSTRPEATPPPVTTSRPRTPLNICLSGVSYTYRGAESPALSSVDLELPAHTCTALLGRTGAGKSTLVNLLLRLLDPTAGSILVGGVQLSTLQSEVWHQYVSLVPQQPHLFAGTILENILLARPRASRSEVTRAADLAGVSSLVARLPDGLDTAIGERGARLSAGELQRVAMARAFLKDTPCLILDEPTSSLDPESEGLLRDALSTLAHDRTVLVVAHRLNTIRLADRIAVLEDGCLVESGDRDTLMASKGAYAALAHAHHLPASRVDG